MSKEAIAYLERQTCRKWRTREEHGELRYESSGFTPAQAELFKQKLYGFKIACALREGKKNPTISLDEEAVRQVRYTFISGLTIAEEMGMSSKGAGR